MVMLKLASPITDINGKLGGVYFRSDQCGPHIQALPRKVERDHGNETSSQKRFRRALSAWIRHKWTQADLDQWWLWSADHPVKNKKGEIRYLTPFLAFLSVNIKRLHAGAPIGYLPP